MIMTKTTSDLLKEYQEYYKDSVNILRNHLSSPGFLGWGFSGIDKHLNSCDKLERIVRHLKNKVNND